MWPTGFDVIRLDARRRGKDCSARLGAIRVECFDVADMVGLKEVRLVRLKFGMAR